MYITYDEVVLRYPMLTTWSDSCNILTNDTIVYAEHELNSLMSTHFSVPFSGSHPTIKDLAIDLAYYRTMVAKDPDNAEKIKDAVLGRIDRIKEGKEYIITDSYTTITPDSTIAGGEVWSTTMGYHPTFSMLDTENKYSCVDSDRLNAEEDARD